MPIEIRPLAAPLGAEALGVDLSRDISQEDQQTLLDAWIQYGILLLRNMPNSDEAHMRLSRVFGEMEPAATAAMNSKDNPYMMDLIYDPQNEDPRFNQHYNVDGHDRAGYIGWHWDQAFMPTIVRGAVLRMVEPAREAGETGFADAIAAYDRLPDDLKARIEGLEVIYDFCGRMDANRFGVGKLRALPRKEVPSKDSKTGFDFPAVVHPLVITQHETGRKVLKLCPMHFPRIMGMDEVESDALIGELTDYLLDPAHVYYHKWRKGDMVVWDNWRVVHSAAGVPLDVPRHGRRTTIMGDYAVGRYLDPELDRNRKVTRIVD